MTNALVAVSGGSDSLALLDILYKQNKYNLIVCHVNYHYRDTSNRDEQIVVDFCERKKIKYHILSLNSKEDKDGNFEDWARVKSYKFFKEVYDKENCGCLLVGHQQDDVLETYIIQKQRNAIVEYYGLKQECDIQGMKVVRPLLDKSNKELEDYCKNLEIEYGVDETNYDLNYSRNRIRHNIVSNMSEIEKEQLLKEIEEKNKIKIEHVEYVKKIKEECLIEDNVLSLVKWKMLDFSIQKEVIYYFLIDNLYKKISISDGRIEDIIKKINSNKPNIELAQYEKMILYKEYNFLVLEENKEEYCYPIADNKQISEISGFFISENGKKLERVVASKDQFPLYLKNYDGTNPKINRVFINKKIPLRQRKTWPVIVDKFGSLLLVINIKKFYNQVWNFPGNYIDFYVCKCKGE